jgi:osmotically-inducible protein OsmY
MIQRDVVLLGLLAALPLLHGCFAAVAAGTTAAVVVAEDRRTTGIYFEDQNIEQKVTNAIRSKYGSNDQVQARVTSFNRYILLTGEAPDEATKTDIGVIALGVENVRNVQNELVIGQPTSVGERASDAALTTRVRGRFVSENKFQPNHVVVTSRNGVVYLMGMVSREEADAATEIARTTGGVQKVVRVFEITS